jgi:hypothetical protein
MGLTKCCCCVDLLKGVKILGIVLIVLTCLSIAITIGSIIGTGSGSLYGLFGVGPGLYFKAFYIIKSLNIQRLYEK